MNTSTRWNAPGSDRRLREDAIAIWQAGVNAVRAETLVLQSVRVEGDELWVEDNLYNLNRIRRIVVVGAGKAGAGMARGIELAIGPQLLESKNVVGWVNVPADCVQPLARIHLHAARPAGVNEPTDDGVFGTLKILNLVQNLQADDLCLVLLSGGGSALLPAPLPGIEIADKQLVTKFLSAAGANIAQLNTVRKQLSRIKGGGLARARRAGEMVVLVVSDVLGDPLDLIASGPACADSSSPRQALEILEQFDARGKVPAAIFDVLEDRIKGLESTKPVQENSVPHFVIGNNAVAVDAAGVEAVARGYSHAMMAARTLEGDAETVGREWADHAVRLREPQGPDCLVTGGEPVVKLVAADQRGRGGRNQQLVLAAVERLIERAPLPSQALDGLVILSGGTDGEDGPTDAAGAYFDAAALAKMQEKGMCPQDFLRRNDAYHFFQPLDRLLITGPTHTNVCDLRVIVARKAGD